MEQREVMPLADMKVLMNHIYEYKKGVRQMVLYTFNEKYRDFAVNRLEKQSIDYIIQPVGNGRSTSSLARGSVWRPSDAW